MATERLALTPSGQVRYALKSPYRDGTTHLVLEPLDLMARLAARVPPSRMHLTRRAITGCSRSRSTPAPAARDGCGGIASIEEPQVIARILAHRDRDCGTLEPELAPIAARAPPRQGRLR